jgi:hypothetical protein
MNIVIKNINLKCIKASFLSSFYVKWIINIIKKNLTCCLYLNKTTEVNFFVFTYTDVNRKSLSMTLLEMECKTLRKWMAS